ncbi:hypothetical protein [Nocardia sp. NPDC004711]
MTENGIPAPTTQPATGWVVVVPATGRAVALRGVTVHATPASAEAAADALAVEMTDWLGVDLALKVISLADYVPPATEAPAFAPAPADLSGLAAAYPAPRPVATYEYALARGAWLYTDADTQARGRAYTSYASAADAREDAEEIIEGLAEREIDGYGLTVVRRATVTTVCDWEIA